MASDNARRPIKALPYISKDLAEPKELIVDYDKHEIYLADKTDPSKLYNLNSEISSKVLISDTTNTKINLTLPNGYHIIDETLGDVIYDIYSSFSKLGFNTNLVEATDEYQTSFEIPFPFENYNNDNGNTFLLYNYDYTLIPYTKYTINNNNTLTITDSTFTIPKGKSITFIFLYNSIDSDDYSPKVLDGRYIANNSIENSKLKYVSNSITNPDSNYLATSSAVCSLYDILRKSINSLDTNRIVYASTSSDSTPRLLSCNIDDYILTDNSIINLALTVNITANCMLKINNSTNYYIYDGTSKLSVDIPSGQTLTLLFSDITKCFYIINDISDHKIKTFNSTVIAVKGQDTIRFDISDYNSFYDKLMVYQNNMRLFENINYTVDHTARTITLIDYTSQDGDIFVFEVERLIPFQARNAISEIYVDQDELSSIINNITN